MTAFKRKARIPAKKSGLKEILQKASRTKRIKHIFILSILLLLLIFLGSGSRGTIKLWQISNEVETIEQDIKLLEEEKKRLEEIKYKIENDSTYMEKIAREKYKMKKKGEKVYEIIEE
jgi:cell division protein FtsB